MASHRQGTAEDALGDSRSRRVTFSDDHTYHPLPECPPSTSEHDPAAGKPLPKEPHPVVPGKSIFQISFILQIWDCKMKKVAGMDSSGG
jgi:hypothetical protein